MRNLLNAAILTAGLTFATHASAVLITFEDLAAFTILSHQYAASGLIFEAGGFAGSGGPNGNWATNTDMTIVSSTGTDVGALGTPSLVSGELLHSFNGWLGEDGDPSFRMNFTTAISSISAAFAGIANPSRTRMFVYDGTTLLGTTVATTTTGQQTLAFAAAHITSVVVTPGALDDWVGVDNIDFTPISGTPPPITVVPEPGTILLLALGLGLIVLARRREASANARRARRPGLAGARLLANHA